MDCPKCGNEMWNNIGNKRNPRSPDWKCKNRQCGHAIWDEPSAPRTSGVPPTSGKWTWGQLSKLYGNSLLLAEKHVVLMGERRHVAIASAEILSAAATIFIAASRDGVKAEVRTPPPSPPEPEQVPDEEDVPW